MLSAAAARVRDAACSAGKEKRGAFAHLFVRQFLHLRLEVLDLGDEGVDRFEEPLVTAAENFG